MIDSKKAQSLRKKRNQELIQKMRNGEDLRSFDPEASWFPPRPKVKKDKDSIKKLFSNQK